jgi:hypothetical protein
LLGSGALSVAATAGAQVSGAIHTTTPDGTIVNENVHYQNKADVFLTGGPGLNAPPAAAGLPPGEYYFQITDPSGKKLLSTDAVRNRCVVVGGQGYIINQRCGGSTGPGDHLLNPKFGTASEFVVQMIPYDDTPNNGGVYKAWMTPVGAFVGNIDAVDNTCNNNSVPGCFHGFVESSSKTDNFKVRDVQTYCITAWKFIEDKKKGETLPASGWPIVFAGNIEHTSDGTNPDDPLGSFTVCELTAGTYTISELLKPDYIVVGTQINHDVLSTPVTSVMVTVGKGNQADRNPVVVWTNRNVNDNGCTKDCYYK